MTLFRNGHSTKALEAGKLDEKTSDLRSHSGRLSFSLQPSNAVFGSSSA